MAMTATLTISATAPSATVLLPDLGDLVARLRDDLDRADALRR